MLRDLSKETEGAVEILVALLKSADERVRLQAANKLLDLRKECEVIINTDDIQRMLLESKNPDRVRGLVEDDDSPDIDFTQIQNV
jgi:HEAT repeat protein